MQSVRKALYLTLVRSQLAYGSQVWAPQTVNNIQTVEHVQRRATKCRTVNYQNSYYIRAAKVWNTLPSNIRDTTKSLTSFKTLLRKHYKDLTDSVFNPDDPRTLKSVCVKCHTSRPL